jgi:carbamoyltransferase
MINAHRRFRAEFGANKYQWHWISHHLAHAASAYYPSGFDKAAILIVDGSGELAATSWYSANNGLIEHLGSINFPNSYGYFYSSLTQWLGFKPAVNEGKTMGLAAHGEVDNALLAHFREMIDDNGVINRRWFRYQYGSSQYFAPLWETTFGPARVPESLISDQHIAVAAAGQARLEELLLFRLRELGAFTRHTKLCLAGGVALNCAANGRFLRDTLFDDLFVQPAAHDAGSAYGAALWVHAQNSDEAGITTQRSTAWGPSFDDDQIDLALQAHQLEPVTCISAEEEVARLLAAGKVVGWFDGAMEFGPRALGQHSILADPRNPDMADHVNARVKHREAFRPFAPAVLEHRVNDYFEGKSTPFMTTVMKVRSNCRKKVPAITHTDGTARVQTVSQDNGALFDLLVAFERRTGIPMLLNTSFNQRGEAIVCTPQEAIADYLDTDMDGLYLQGKVVVKEDRRS